MIKFSDAMLLGLPEIRFHNGVWLCRDISGQKECSGCLVGAALYAVGERVAISARQALYRHWPWMQNLPPAMPFCPSCGEAIGGDIPCVATHLANHYEAGHITAEQIADYFRTVEPAEEPVEQVAETEDEYSCT